LNYFNEHLSFHSPAWSREMITFSSVLHPSCSFWIINESTFLFNFFLFLFVTIRVTTIIQFLFCFNLFSYLFMFHLHWKLLNHFFTRPF
jgi:hypothetical protein